MTKISSLANVLFPLVVISLCVISRCSAALSDKQLCYDPNCSEVVSLAKTILAYRANDREVMSFDVNVDVKVFSKGAGRRTDLWGVEINGKRGFAPKSFLNEYKVLKRVLSYEVPVYKFTDKAQTKKLESTEKVDKVHPLLKDKLPHDEVLAPLAKSADKNVQKEKVKTEKLESIDKTQEASPSFKDKLSHDDNRAPSLSANFVDKTVQESEVNNDINNAGSISPSYEVIDGTTFYLENKPSVQPSFVTETVHTTALLDEQLSRTDFQDSDNSGDKTTSVNSEALPNTVKQPNTENIELQGIKLPAGIHKETGTEVLLEGSQAIINATVDTVSKDHGTLSLDESGESEEDEPLKNLQRETTSTDSNSEENIEYNDKEKDAENIENEGILASLARKLNILSSSQVGTTESTTSEASIETSKSAPETTATTSDSQLQKHTLNDVEVKDAVTEANILNTQTLQSSIDSNVKTKNEKEVQKGIIHKSTESLKISDEIKTEEGVSANLLETVTSPSDVPSANNFVHEGANKSANDLPIASSILANDSSISVEADSSHAESIKMQKSSEKENVIENIETEGIIASLGEESTILSNEQETATTDNTQTSNDIEQRLPENSDEKHLENIKQDGYKELLTTVKVDVVAATNKVPETSSLSFEKTTENITEVIPDSRTIEGEKEKTVISDETLSRSGADIQFNEELIVHSNINKNDNLVNDVSSADVPTESNEFSNDVKSSILSPDQSVDSSQEKESSEQTLTLDKLSHNRNLLNIENLEHKDIDSHIDNSVKDKDKILSGYGNHINSEDKVLYKDEDIKEDSNQVEESESKSILDETEVISDEVCLRNHECSTENIVTPEILQQKTETENEEDYMMDITKLDHDYLKTLIYLSVTAFTTLVFTLGYYYIENIRRDVKLIARINKLEKELLVSTKECEVLSENLKSTKEKLHCIQDESFGSNEMVVSLKADLEVSQNIKAELEDQVTMLEKDLEGATEAGLELERMLREVLSSNNEVNPLAQSVEDLQARLDAQQAANESLTNALNLKTQEIEILTVNVSSTKKKCKGLETELLRAQDELTTQGNLKNNIEQTLTDKINNLEVQINELSIEKSSLHKELKGKEAEMKELGEIISQVNSNNLDLDKLYDVCRVKTEAVQLREERDELKVRLSDVEGAHQLLEEHMKLVKEEIAALSDQCKVAEKEKKDAETRLEVLSKFFKEKEAERQKEEAIWLQKQGEVVSTVERIHTMQNEIQNYKQQIEMLKREIVDQEREYKNQISALETKAHEQWVTARQNERRLEETKAEAGQLRNRLTLVEKNLNDSDSETKLHRLEANGETATSPPLFLGAESSGSPVMFNTSVPPPPPGYLHCFPPYLPPLPPTASALPPYDISQRPPPLGGRLSSPPPMPLHPPPAPGGRYENTGSPPPSMSPRLLPPYNRHRSPPPPPFGGDHIPPPPLLGSILPPPIGTAHPWGEESLPHLRNSGFHQREQRVRNHKGSLHSSGESLDKAHHGKV